LQFVFCVFSFHNSFASRVKGFAPIGSVAHLD
jgi:hypothetical protein